MIELFQDALNTPAGSFAFIFAILAVSFFAVWKISHFTTKFGSVQKIEDTIGHIREDMHYVKASIKLFSDANNPFAQRQSPVSLTEIGDKVAREINVSDIMENHWDDIYSQVNDDLADDCNPYDIQVVCFKIGEGYQEFLTAEELKRVKSHAFKAGYNLQVYNVLFGIIIRDKVLGLRGYKSSDVDKFDPKKA